MRKLFAFLEKVAASDINVLIEGESGTGKEVVASEISQRGPRADKAFVIVDCGAISPSLVESELFGHVRGAFTGADRDRVGAFEAADGGTVFLDEIGELPLELQPKLLRTIEARAIRRVGETRSRKVDVRVIAATNRDLERQVAENTFREDLYYRLNVIPVTVPPLRERREDVPLLVNHFVKKYAKSAGRAIAQVSPESFSLLSTYEWPGNVRQLENTIERAVALETGETLNVQVPVERSRARAAAAGVGADTVSVAVPAGAVLPEGMDMEKYVAEIERSLLKSALQQSSGVQTRAADVLRISYRSFRHLMKKYEL
jgi:two-component system response regulator PilR (NtrC family)